MHGCGTQFYTILEQLDHFGSEVGQKNSNFLFAKQGCQKYPRGNLAPPWSLPNLYGLLESLRCFFPEFALLTGAFHTGSEQSDRFGPEVGQKKGRNVFSEHDCQKYGGE